MENFANLKEKNQLSSRTFGKLWLRLQLHDFQNKRLRQAIFALDCKGINCFTESLHLCTERLSD